MSKQNYPDLWAKYNSALVMLQKPVAAKTTNGQERAYRLAAEKLMHVGELYKIKAKYRGR